MLRRREGPQHCSFSSLPSSFFPSDFSNLLSTLFLRYSRHAHVHTLPIAKSILELERKRLTLLSFVGENRIESELFRSVTRIIIIIIIRLYHPSICRFVDDRPPRNYLRYVVVKRKRTVVEEKKKGWARDTKVKGG